MATIKLVDGFGLVINTASSPSSAFSKYLKSPDTITAVLKDAEDIRDTQVGQDPFKSKSVGISFDKSITLGTTGIDLTIAPELLGTIAIKKGDSLFDAASDPFGDKIAIPAKQAYVSTALEAKVNLGLSDKTGGLQFGFNAGTDVVCAHYRLFNLTDNTATALENVIQNFAVPADVQDVQTMASGDVATVDGTGSLKFSATANLLTAVNPLAVLNTTICEGPLKIKDSAAVSVGATYTLTGEYQIRVQRFDGSKFRLGFEKKRTSELDVTASADFGLSATADGFDIIKTLLGTVSSEAVPDKDAFQKAGLTADQIATISAAIKAGIQKKLELSLAAEVDSLNSESAAFCYDVDLSMLDAQGKQAVHSALHGDLSLLEQGTVGGVTPVKSVFSALRQGKHSLKVNLLGIFNYASATTLFQKGTIIVDRESGEITIADQAGATRIQFTSDHFAKDGAQLRHVLAESFLMTVGYRSSGTLPFSPALSTTHWFFELNQSTNPAKIKDYLNVANALNLCSSSDVTARLTSLAGISAFGRSTLYATASYDDPLSKSLFINASAQPRAREEYEGIGRRAFTSLLLEGDSSNVARRLPMTNDQVWSQMRLNGQANDFAGLFNEYGFNANQLRDIGSDYTLIVWWAGAMSGMAVALSNLLAYVAQHPQADAKFKELRASLDSAMGQVANHTQSQFAEPWGLLAMDLASGQKAKKSLQLVCPRVVLALSSGGVSTKAASTSTPS
jgi:hypothetical protein